MLDPRHSFDSGGSQNSDSQAVSSTRDSGSGSDQGVSGKSVPTKTRKSSKRRVFEPHSSDGKSESSNNDYQGVSSRDSGSGSDVVVSGKPVPTETRGPSKKRVFQPYHSVSVPKTRVYGRKFDSTDGDINCNDSSASAASEKKTTVMIRNIPNKYDQKTLLAEFHKLGFSTDLMDFMYLPMDVQNRSNVGYAFINFVKSSYADDCFRVFTGYKFQHFLSKKIAKVCYAHVQGLAPNLEALRHRAVSSSKNAQYRPLVIQEGKRVENIGDFMALRKIGKSKAREPTNPGKLPDEEDHSKIALDFAKNLVTAFREVPMSDGRITKCLIDIRDCLASLDERPEVNEEVVSDDGGCKGGEKSGSTNDPMLAYLGNEMSVVKISDFLANDPSTFTEYPTSGDGGSPQPSSQFSNGHEDEDQNESDSKSTTDTKSRVSSSTCGNDMGLRVYV